MPRNGEETTVHGLGRRVARGEWGIGRTNRQRATTSSFIDDLATCLGDRGGSVDQGVRGVWLLLADFRGIQPNDRSVARAILVCFRNQKNVAVGRLKLSLVKPTTRDSREVLRIDADAAPRPVNAARGDGNENPGVLGGCLRHAQA